MKRLNFPISLYLKVWLFVELIYVNERHADVGMGGFARDVNTQFTLMEKVKIVIGITAHVVDDDKIPVIYWHKND